MESRARSPNMLQMFGETQFEVTIVILSFQVYFQITSFITSFVCLFVLSFVFSFVCLLLCLLKWENIPILVILQKVFQHEKYIMYECKIWSLKQQVFTTRFGSILMSFHFQWRTVNFIQSNVVYVDIMYISIKRNIRYIRHSSVSI